jgi:hypothetical protein
MQRVLLSLCCGAVLEVVALLILAKLSTESPSIGLTLVEYTQAPSVAVLRLAYHFIVPPVPRATATAVFTVLFFMQTSILALPAWLLMRRWPENPK